MISIQLSSIVCSRERISLLPASPRRSSNAVRACSAICAWSESSAASSNVAAASFFVLLRCRNVVSSPLVTWRPRGVFPGRRGKGLSGAFAPAHTETHVSMQR
ncbi:MAG: hypothetical protein DWQ31_19010 [Planctomycetota bacterium]|nr:MAG: hypothetical protein DWQ31_19010 [Planctomycetota bacterium]